MTIDRGIAQSIVAGNGHRWTRLTIYFLRQCLTIDTITHLLPPTISIDGYLSQIYCCRQHRSMDTFHNQLSPTIYIDRLPASSIVQAVDHCCVYCPGCAMYRVHHLHDGDLLRLWYCSMCFSLNPVRTLVSKLRKTNVRFSSIAIRRIPGR